MRWVGVGRTLRVFVRKFDIKNERRGRERGKKMGVDWSLSVKGKGKEERERESISELSTP